MQLKTERQSTKSKASSDETKKFNTLNFEEGTKKKTKKKVEKNADSNSQHPFSFHWNTLNS
jgi:hypothetical protein